MPNSHFKNLIQMNSYQEHSDLIKRTIATSKGFASTIAEYAHKKNGKSFSIDMIDLASSQAMAAFADHLYQQLSSLAAIHRSPFFCNVKATTTTKGKPHLENYLFSKARFPGEMLVDNLDATLLSWTSPLYAKICGARPFTTIDYEGPSGRPVCHQIHSSSDWAKLLPMAEGIVIRLQDKDLVITDEESISAADAVKILTAGEYDPSIAMINPEALAVKPAFGLGEIITLADSTQKAAMHLPFKEDVLIEGPPGSGKTSVGLMRIPCLIDRQWEELHRDIKKDTAFHSEESIKVLVMNSEMVPYLDGLMRDITITRVKVETFSDFCKAVCTAIHPPILAGIERKCTSGLDRAKFSQAGFETFITAVKKRIATNWNNAKQDILRKFTDVHPIIGSVVFKKVDAWVTAVGAWNIALDTSNPDLNISQTLNQWALIELKNYDPPQFKSEISNIALNEKLLKEKLAKEKALEEDRKNQRDAIKRLCSMCNTFIKQALDRKSIIDQLEPDQGLSATYIDEWKAQMVRHNDLTATRTEADHVLHGFLTSLFLLGKFASNVRPLVGGIRPYLTHVVIDEAQDISEVHLRILRCLLDKDGTLTLVGDLRQRIDGPGYFESWNDLPLKNPKLAVFSINHRQTKEIGAFVRDQHLHLFGLPANWMPSNRSGPDVNILETSGSNLGTTISVEVLNWIKAYPNCRCGVLFIADHSIEKLDELRTEIEKSLQDEIVSVELASPDNNDRPLRKESGVILAPVGLTKGLEFDVVVLVAPIIQESETQKNRFYVGCSRARTALSVIKHS